ncbi:MAG: hypothetical protein ACLQLG_18605 [Thermoguttaceae bacterium]
MAGLIGNPGLQNNATSGKCLAAVKTAKVQAAFAYNSLHDALWQPPAGTTVPQAFAALGTAYAALAADMSALGQFLAAEGYALPAPPAGWTVTVNADGSATAAQS